MISVYPTLVALRDTLAGIAGVATCRIGLEANLKPDDYPMIRIVPSRILAGGLIATRATECLVYFGQPMHEFTAGLEGQYEELLEMEAAICQLIEGDAVRGQVLETIADEDRVEGYKLMAIRARVEG